MILSELTVEQNALDLMTVADAFANNVLPISIEGDTLTIAIANKLDLKLISDLSFYTGYKINPLQFPADVILSRLKMLFPEGVEDHNKMEAAKDNITADFSNVEFVNQIITEAIKTSASDLHFEVYENQFRIRLRIDGHLREIANLPFSRSMPIFSRIKIMADLDISEKRRPQDGKIKFPYKERLIDIRVSSIPTSFGEKVVLRILDRSALQLDLCRMGFHPAQLQVLERNLSRPYGMILVTGPTGSGKSTSLYAALQFIHSPQKNLLTIEDPIEYNLPGINQSHVKPEIGYTFANALRSFLRQDPDVIMVGEIRDTETAEIAVRASLTGHLVLSTLHTNDSVSAVVRLIDMGIEPYLVASSVKLIIAQRLVRKLCKCKTPNTTDLETQAPFMPRGCDDCNGTGFKGRTALFEFFEIDEQLSELIAKNPSVAEIKSLIMTKGFKSLHESGLEKIKSGITTYEEVLRETML